MELVSEPSKMALGVSIASSLCFYPLPSVTREYIKEGADIFSSVNELGQWFQSLRALGPCLTSTHWLCDFRQVTTPL